MKAIQKIDGKLKILSLLLLFVFIQIISLGATLTVDTTKTRVGVPLKIMVKSRWGKIRNSCKRGYFRS